MTDGDSARLHATLEGRVQGVGFRFFVQETAVSLHLRGWVRNLWSGGVEVVAEGNRLALEQLLAALRHGPRGAYVSGVDFEWEEHAGEFKSFYVRSTF